MVKLSIEERETIFSIAADARKTLHVCSTDPQWIRKLDKIAKPTETDSVTHWYELDLNECTFTLRKKTKRKPMSDEMKRKAGERLAKARKRKVGREGYND